MFRFEYPLYLNLLWFIPLLVLIYIAYNRYQQSLRAQLGTDALLNRLIPGWAPQRNHIKMGLIIAGLLCLFLAYANPQWGNKKDKVTAKSSDIFIALDISQSMMAEDISPNRLERSKRLLQNLIKTLRGNRVGLIYFAGNAYLQMPLTNDYSAALLFANSANTKQASTQGTAINEAIEMALRAYQPGEATQKALIIITDGENHDNEAIASARKARERGLRIYTIGVGTTEGALVPYQSQGSTLYKRDENGQPVNSKLNTALIKDIANAGDGRSYLIGQGAEILTDLKRQIALLEKEEVEQRAFSDYASYFQYLLGLGIVLFILEFILSGKRRIVA